MDFKLNEKLDSLKNQLKQAETLFYECQGAIKITESLIKEESEYKKAKKNKKQFFEINRGTYGEKE